eukprot:TRINITY_DN1710_c0_g1_i3.p1 TRINITY_DN1710_c0_g1~~TRINITY_DN1710_c0_g1_i3.p1  ORF type:complete len:436 (+),score=34.89 TRINITY_DN1710_c0_g1_i3:406-1713(+)
MRAFVYYNLLQAHFRGMTFATDSDLRRLEILRKSARAYTRFVYDLAGEPSNLPKRHRDEHFQGAYRDHGSAAYLQTKLFEAYHGGLARMSANHNDVGKAFSADHALREWLDTDVLPSWARGIVAEVSAEVKKESRSKRTYTRYQLGGGMSKVRVGTLVHDCSSDAADRVRLIWPFMTVLKTFNSNEAEARTVNVGTYARLWASCEKAFVGSSPLLQSAALHRTGPFGGYECQQASTIPTCRVRPGVLALVRLSGKSVDRIEVAGTHVDVDVDQHCDEEDDWGGLVCINDQEAVDNTDIMSVLYERQDAGLARWVSELAAYDNDPSTKPERRIASGHGVVQVHAFCTLRLGHLDTAPIALCSLLSPVPLTEAPRDDLETLSQRWRRSGARAALLAVNDLFSLPALPDLAGSQSNVEDWFVCPSFGVLPRSIADAAY